MAIQAGITHQTRYTYARPATLSPQVIRLRPAPHTRTRVKSYSLKISPAQHFINWQQDPFGNWLARIVFPEKVKEFKIEVDLIAEMSVINPFDFFVEAYADKFPFVYERDLKVELTPYLQTDEYGPELEAHVAAIRRALPAEGVQITEFIANLNRKLSQEIKYLIRMEPGVQTPQETLRARSGSCRDSGWLLVQILRKLGIAARFTSGYLIQLTPDVKSLDGPSGTSYDFTDLHAWAEAFIPGAGWIGLDPTSGLLCGEGHIPLASTPHYRSAAPVTGASEAIEVEFGHHMEVRRVAEHPRVTKPFNDQAWAKLVELGERVDRDLVAQDVRLTMGGEPTFVSIDDFQSAEWNTAAVGPHKRRLADALIHRLRERFAPNGFIQHGQGKWYPGETLPRWTFSLYWRRDGKPIWRDPSLFEREASDADVSTNQAADLLTAIAERLAVDTANVAPVYEDPVYWALQEGRLPENVDPTDPKLEDEEARARMMRVFDRGVGNAIGYALPLQAWQARDGVRWVSENWLTRRKKLFAIPGDSSVGYRLPLMSLNWLSPGNYPFVEYGDPFEDRGALPDPEELAQPYQRSPAERRARQIQIQQRLGSMNVRTAVTIEPRDGRLYVFMPPMTYLEEYLELLAAIEIAASTQGLKVQIEGYPPPPDHRLNVIKVGPDPGVIEVNTHPSSSWADCIATATGLYEDARASRLGTEKFMLDGRHTGTGGGNHVVVGGSSPANSPFLRRPDLLKSLILYWQRHPSLSYLFSGMFIGPTSQAPRVDEARQDAMYELELALSQINPNNYSPPWFVDRVLRNLLTDVTGNTHRTEICIDKLYSPDGPTGRLGLVEFRSFEMPPDAKMSLAQQLLLRALIAWFWREPQNGTLARWGTALHDKFLLPDPVWADFKEVARDLGNAGYKIDLEWFEAQFEFRFPFIGEAQAGEVLLELRTAIEPWHVTGETGAIGGTVRYVDSSVERLQVRARGLNPQRHVVACNGRRVPLMKLEETGDEMAGVRYKAWMPAAGFHPMLRPNVPLTFDVLDTWSERSLGGCVYCVAHPGGRNYDTFPVNAYEAEGRRMARFQAFGHTGGRMSAPPREINSEFPRTLDLRRPPA